MHRACAKWECLFFDYITCLFVQCNYYVLCTAMKTWLDLTWMAKEKYDLVDGCTILIFSTDDGCTRWWRWLHQFRWVIFDKHTADPLQTNMNIGCMIVVKCDMCKIFRAYAPLVCIATRIVGNLVLGIACRSLMLQKERTCIFWLFHPQLKTNLWIINLTPQT